MYSQIIAFDRPLASVAVPGVAGRQYTEAEVAVLTQAAYDKGGDAVRSAADHQMVQFRADVQHLCDDVLSKLSALEPAFVVEVRDALPSLALDIAKRLMAGFEPPPEALERLWHEALDELYPEREGLELSLCPQDADLLENINPEWRKRYPGLQLTRDASLRRGDVMVRSRFGLIDSRQQTKLQALTHSLTGT